MKKLLIFLAAALPLCASEVQPIFNLETRLHELVALPDVKKALGEDQVQARLASYILTEGTVGSDTSLGLENIYIALFTLTMNSISWRVIHRLSLESEFEAFLAQKKVYEYKQATDLKGFVEDAQSLKNAYEAFFKECSKKADLPSSNELLDLMIPEIQTVIHILFKQIS